MCIRDRCEAFDAGAYSQFVQRAVNAVRQVAPQLMVWFDSNALHGVGAQTYVGPIEDPSGQLGFSWHNYDRVNPAAPFQNAQSVLSRKVVGIMSEFGATTNVSVWSAVLEQADISMSSWMFWAWSNNPSFKFANNTGLPKDPRAQGLVYDPSKALIAPNTHPEAMGALARPYPYLTPGHLEGFSFDDSSKTLRVVFSLSQLRGPREARTAHIMCSELTYPNGYLVRAGVLEGQGFTRVTSERNSKDLMVVVEPIWRHGHVRVQVEVTPV
eukprot:TRINITY_DN50972_c0_g1_i1.p1 TRINITY_DN50972_c0_g1~~TRINITY_DN50972_c0_g1_i1.p1  ORF type:complete len:269 (-),score=45.08 TRINITY_DN50972_c0_g1_i1:95-901(-)